MEDPDVAAALRFIERNLARKIRVRDVVAGIAASSRRSLERRFRDGPGRSIAAELRRLRILKAKRLLSETGLLVKQVAHESGFGDPIRLHEVFLREVGMAPGAYRKKTALAGRVGGPEATARPVPRSPLRGMEGSPRFEVRDRRARGRRP
jgi:LacI family transcriptional regulator